MTPEPVNPRHDPDFADRCLWDLIMHAGEWRRLGRLYAASTPFYDRCCVVRDAVDRGRRLGLQIEGDNPHGYRLVGICCPQYIYKIKPGGPSRASGQS